MRAGMYSYPDILPVPVINAAGQDVGDGVELTEFIMKNRNRLYCLYIY